MAATLLWRWGFMGWLYVGLLVGGWFFTGSGITVGFHRLLTHRSFETHPLVKAVLLILGSMAVQGAVTDWVANHVKHHAHADDPSDPHSPRAGFPSVLVFRVPFRPKGECACFGFFTVRNSVQRSGLASVFPWRSWRGEPSPPSP